MALDFGSAIGRQALRDLVAWVDVVVEASHNAIAALKLALKGAILVDAESAFEVERSVPHGNVAAAHVMAEKLGLRSLLGPPSKDRGIAYALILSRAVRPKFKLYAVRWWNSGDTTLASDLGIAYVTIDDVYDPMDWLLGQKGAIGKKFARRHLREGGIAMYDLSSSRVEGTRCELAAFGYSRDGKRGRAPTGYGLLTDPGAPGRYRRVRRQYRRRNRVKDPAE